MIDITKLKYALFTEAGEAVMEPDPSLPAARYSYAMATTLVVSEPSLLHQLTTSHAQGCMRQSNCSRGGHHSSRNRCRRGRNRNPGTRRGGSVRSATNLAGF